MSKNYSKIGKNVIDLEIEALKKVKKLIGKSFNEKRTLCKNFYI